MREIKFRVWDNEQHFMLYDNDNILTNLGYLIKSGKNITWGEWFKKNYYEIINDPADYIIMQYVGLKDKNGKEIYEGDIVQGISYEYEEMAHANREVPFYARIKYDLKYCRFIVCCEDGDILDLCEEEKLEIIGNIYENPELMEE